MSEHVDTLEAVHQTLADWLDIAGTIAVVVGVGFALLCLLGLIARRRREMTGQLDAGRRDAGRRDAELAESTLAAFYQARDYLTWVRLGATPGGEGSSRPGRENDENGQQTFRIDACYTVIERLKGQSEFWSRFLASRHRFRALFGDTSTKPFKDICRVRDDVIGAAQELLEIYGPMPDKAAQESREQVRNLESIIWHRSKQDALEARITGAVRAMEEFCRPVIYGQRSRSRRRRANARF
jgi:hypothetical protein